MMAIDPPFDRRKIEQQERDGICLPKVLALTENPKIDRTFSSLGF
jgi:hypothetical protein